MKYRIAAASMVTMVALALLAASFGMRIDDGSSKLSLAAASLQPLPVEQVAGEADRNMLQVNNQTPFIIIVHVGGVRIGWMRPYRTGLIRGLLSGYHTLYAHSQYGTMSWGPRDAWIPGSWNLLY